jgi:hypothetical protein
MPAWYCTSTTSRYLWPPMLNTTRLLPQMLALAYWSLMSRGLRQVALIASAHVAEADCGSGAAKACTR